MKTIQEKRKLKEQKAKQERQRKTTAANDRNHEGVKQTNPAREYKRKRFDFKTGKLLTLTLVVFAFNALAACNSSRQEPFSAKKIDSMIHELQQFHKDDKAAQEQLKKELKKRAISKNEIAKLRVKIAKNKELDTKMNHYTAGSDNGQ